MPNLKSRTIIINTYMKKPLFSDPIAYDISKSTETVAELWDNDAIQQSIELILTTNYGERLFNPLFGCPLASYNFQMLDTNTGNNLLDVITGCIRAWETRIVILDQELSMYIDYNDSSFTITIPYIIKKTGAISAYVRKIIL